MSLCSGQETPRDKPLTLEELNKPHHSQPVLRKPPQHNQAGINQALQELRHLETGQRVTPHLIHQVEDKENYMVPGTSAHLPPSHPGMFSQQPPGQYSWRCKFPFRTVKETEVHQILPSTCGHFVPFVIWG